MLRLADTVLHALPAPLHRAGLRLAHALRRGWWRLARPHIEGCRVIALDATGRVLLVRHAYGSQAWMPPGGGLKRGEDAALAGARELWEEINCQLDHARDVGLLTEKLHGATNHVHLILGTTADTPRPDRREIAEAAFFALDALPQDLANGLAEALPRWIRGETGARA